MQRRLVAWHCRERGTGHLLEGPAWPARVARGPRDAEEKGCLPVLEKPLRVRWRCGCPAPLGHTWDPAGEPWVPSAAWPVGGNELCPWLGAVPFQREPEAGRERVAASRTRPEKRGVERKSIACVCLGPEEPAGPGLGCASGLWQRLAKGDVPGHRRAEGWQLLTPLSPRTCPCRALPARGGCGG